MLTVRECGDALALLNPQDLSLCWLKPVLGELSSLTVLVASKIECEAQICIVSKSR